MTAAGTTMHDPPRYDPERGLYVYKNSGADRRRWVMEKFLEEVRRGDVKWSFEFHGDVIEQGVVPFRIHDWSMSQQHMEVCCFQCGFSFLFTYCDLQSFTDDRRTVVCLRCGKPTIRDGVPA